MQARRLHYKPQAKRGGSVSSEVKRRPDRSAGILLHPTSLPGRYGIGDLGPTAYAWVDTLVRAGQTWWQVLPLGPTGYGDSPYSSFSAFAGNPYLISPDVLVREGLLHDGDVADAHFPGERVEYGRVIEFKRRMLRRAWDNFRGGAAQGLRGPFEDFCRRQAAWLDDYALFMALKDAHPGKGWQDWPHDMVQREPGALERARREQADAVGLHEFGQFLFFRQWQALKGYANGKGVRLMGDIPIFVSGDSADVWANPGMFQLDAERRPTVVAGVPPDYFSKTGQLWGNPHYNWDALRQTGYAWWVARIRATLGQVDTIRLDHFRGFEACWAVPAGRSTAEVGTWVRVPGLELFETVRRELGKLPLIAEDLGLITPEVEALRDRLNLPGMRILQFAFGGAVEDRFLPHNYEPNTVVYTGTHDNDTTVGWSQSLGPDEARFLRQYVPHGDDSVAWNLIRLAWMSVADYAMAPLQDVLSLGREARMNLPGRPDGNWGWRLKESQLTDGTLDRLRELTWLYGRLPASQSY
jgi:4-alpha-glucanotransferase